MRPTSPARRRAAAAAILALAPLAGCGGDAPDPGASSPAPLLDPGPPPEAGRAAPGGAPRPSGTVAPEIPADAPLVAFLGDSIAAGLHLPKARAFPSVLQRRLAAEGVPFRLVNAGVSGSTTGEALGRLDWILRQRPAILVVELGANDGFRAVPAETVRENLSRIVARAKEAGARPLLLGMRLPPNYGRAYGKAFEEAYEAVAEEHDVPLVPFFMEGVAGVPALNLDDGIHPTAEGHERLAANTAAALADLLRAK